ALPTAIISSFPNHPPTTQLHTLSLHDALPICLHGRNPPSQPWDTPCGPPCCSPPLPDLLPLRPTAIGKTRRERENAKARKREERSEEHTSAPVTSLSRMPSSA